MWEGQQCEVDTILNVKEGFSTLKVKLDNPNQEFSPPPFLKVTRDITGDIGYKTKYISKRNWYVPSGDEKYIRKESLDM